MAKRLAIAVIHGMGRQRKDDPLATADRRYSEAFHARLRALIPGLDDLVAWREVFWADIVQTRQDAFEERLRAVTGMGLLRSYTLHRFADAACYVPLRRPQGSVYDAVHARIDTTLAHLEQDVAPGAPLMAVAHSLGAYMMSNHIWDVTCGPDPPGSAFRRCRSLAGFLTFGCNIPLFTFGHAELQAITFPGDPGRRADPWWRNVYDPDDPLGYPLSILGGGYADLAEAGELADIQVRLGGRLLPRWNPWRHRRYWSDPRFARVAAEFIREVLARAPGGA